MNRVSSRPATNRKPSLIERMHWSVRLAAAMVLFVICSAFFIGGKSDNPTEMTGDGQPAPQSQQKPAPTS
jgi:hypothetical protein